MYCNFQGIFRRWKVQLAAKFAELFTTTPLKLACWSRLRALNPLTLWAPFPKQDSAHWAFYYTMVHKKSKNLKNGHFLQSRTKIVLIEKKFAKFWHIGGWCAPVCLINTLKKLVFYSKVAIKGGVKQVSKKLNLCKISSSLIVFI